MEATTFSSRKKPPPPPPTSYSKTATNAGGGGYFATSYDDVFGGPPKFASSTALAPRAEDYSEIFGGFRTSSSSRASSSIPVLDLPVANGGEFDSVFDYSDVFGGINAVDFAVPFDELFRSTDGFDASDDDDAWTPVGTESLSDDSDPFAFSEKSQCFMNGSSSQPLEAKQFNVSYHKVSPGTSTCVPDTMHVAQINDVPVYTVVVEESTSSIDFGKERFRSQSVEDIVFSVEAPPIITQKHVKKTISHLPHEGAGLKSFDGDPRSGRARSVSMSHVNSILPSASDISPQTKSSPISPQSTDSRPSPISADRNRGLSGLSSDPQGSENHGFKAAVDSGSPAFFDMEVDVTSSVAASAAAMKDVMEKAHAKLKAAREFRGRKDTLRNGEKVGSDTDVNGEGSAKIAHNETVFVENRLHSTSDRGTSKTKSSSKAKHGKSGSQISPDTCAAEQPIGVSGQSAGVKHSLRMETVSPDVAGEWKEARQYFEFVNNDNSRLSYPPPRHSGVKNAIVKQHNSNDNSTYQPPSTDDKKNATVKQQDNNDNDSDSAGESCVPQTNRRRLKATKAVSRQGYYEKMVKVAQEVHDTVTSGHAQINEGLQDTFCGDSKEHRPKLVIEPEKNEGRSWDTNRAEAEYSEVIKAEGDMNSKNDIENGTMHNRETGASYRDVNDIYTNDPLLNMNKEAVYISQAEGRVNGSCANKEIGRGAHEDIVIEAHEQSTEALEQRMEKETREWKDKRSKEAFRVVFDGERQQTAFDSKEKDKTQDVQQMKADEFAKRTVGRASEGQKNCKATKFQQLDEHKEHLEKVTCGQGPEKMLHQNVELEKCWEYLEDLEQENSKLNLDMGHKLVDEDNSADSWKQNEREEKLEQTDEQENIQSIFKQAGEVGETVNIDEKSDFNGYQNAACRGHVEAEWKAEKQESDSSSDTEISARNKNLKVPDGNDVELDVEPCQLKLPGMKAHGFLNVSAVKENGESGTTLIDEFKSKGIDTSDLEVDAEEMRFSATRVCADDKEVEGKDVHPSLNLPQMKANGSVELSAEKENSVAGTVPFDESTSKAVETNDMIDERETVLSTAQEDPSHDELERRAVHTSHTLHMNDNNTKSGVVLIRHDKVSIKDDKKVAQPVSDPKLVKASDRGMLRTQGMGQGLRGQEENTRPMQSERINGWNEHPKKGVGAHPVMPDKKENFLKSSQYPCISQSIERKGKSIDHNGSLEEKDERKGDLEKDRLRKLEEEKEREREREKDHLRKLEEEKEREREREKDRMAVEVAIREARERAYADARDRAERVALERATEQVRQRTMAEAREKLEKASAEVRERSFSDKAFEARSRAERAAVDQATAEARQRAFEKAMADRAMSETRERMQRSVSEKYTSERDVVMRQSSFPSTSERFQTANGEPAERCKARLERHRRTVDRVAKALAEKNMRDLVAQREQAERNRFAESLDADIKRWSNGKAGNLRALLSTLQYILGPESGWQPIPLTEVITAAAVKKAYRKATLCVHPDKLQQRGASIQQKYICEKVFDLLKEAWNRFNSEEK